LDPARPAAAHSVPLFAHSSQILPIPLYFLGEVYWTHALKNLCGGKNPDRAFLKNLKVFS
jgi:hypothetical protein